MKVTLDIYSFYNYELCYSRLLKYIKEVILQNKIDFG